MNLVELSTLVADEDKAIAYVEGLRWPTGEPMCPHCGTTGRAYRLKSRRGLWKCGACRKQFTVRVGSIFEGSPIPLGKWILAIHLMCSSKKGISSNQLKRELGISYQSAWFLTHRIRLAMAQEPLSSLLGAGGGVVEIDETFIGGRKRTNFHRNKTKEAGKKVAVMTLIDREGDARTFMVPNTKKKTLQDIARPNIDGTAIIITVGNLSYDGLYKHFRSHFAVDHSKQFVRGLVVHTNFAESYHSLLKRAIFGSFHHISERHLPRYLAEFELRWNTRKMSDGERTDRVIKAAEGKRLTYQPLVSH